MVVLHFVFDPCGAPLTFTNCEYHTRIIRVISIYTLVDVCIRMGMYHKRDFLALLVLFRLRRQHIILALPVSTIERAGRPLSVRQSVVHPTQVSRKPCIIDKFYGKLPIHHIPRKFFSFFFSQIFNFKILLGNKILKVKLSLSHM